MNTPNLANDRYRPVGGESGASSSYSAERKVDRSAINMDSNSRAIETASGDYEMAGILQADVVEITEEPLKMDDNEVDIGLDSNAIDKLEDADTSLVQDGSDVLDEDPEMNKNAEAEKRIINEDVASRATERSEADETLNAKGECLPGVEGRYVTTASVETVRVPRKKSEWLAKWLIEAAEWEGRSWSWEIGQCASLSLHRSASEEDLPFKFSRISRRVNTAPAAGTFFTSQAQEETSE